MGSPSVNVPAGRLPGAGPPLPAEAPRARRQPVRLARPAARVRRHGPEDECDGGDPAGGEHEARDGEDLHATRR